MQAPLGGASVLECCSLVSARFDMILSCQVLWATVSLFLSVPKRRSGSADSRGSALGSLMNWWKIEQGDLLYSHSTRTDSLLKTITWILTPKQNQECL